MGVGEVGEGEPCCFFMAAGEGDDVDIFFYIIKRFGWVGR